MNKAEKIIQVIEAQATKAELLGVSSEYSRVLLMVVKFIHSKGCEAVPEMIGIWRGRFSDLPEFELYYHRSIAWLKAFDFVDKILADDNPSHLSNEEQHAHEIDIMKMTGHMLKITLEYQRDEKFK